jgi:sugar phosphate isomerase/epimerase
LSIIGLHWLLAKTHGMQITSPDLEVRRATGRYLAGLVDLCADLGGRIMVFGSPAQRQIPTGTSVSLACDWAVDSWIECLPALAQRDVVLAIEPLGPQETNFLNTAEQTLQVIERLVRPMYDFIWM